MAGHGAQTTIFQQADKITVRGGPDEGTIV
jgi:hypothetical protein